MGRKEKFNYFKAFEKQAELACKEARLLIEVIEDYDTPENLLKMIDRAHEIEHKGDLVCHDVFEAVSRDFVTPIEREDIIALTQSMDDVLDYMEGTIQRFYMHNVQTMHPQAVDFARLLLKSSEALLAAMEDFSNFKNSKKLKKLIVEVGNVEEEADKLFVDVSRDLFTAPHEKPEDMMYTFVWDKLFQRMENAADACEKVSDTMDSIMMKNS